MKKYNEFLFEKLKITKDYNKVLKFIDIEFKYKLDLNIDYYFKIYKTIFDNSELNLNNYKINLLILLSFCKIINNNKSNIIELEKEIKNNNIFNLSNSSFLILNNIYKILLIVKKTLKDTDILFNNRFILNKIFEYLNNKKINIYQFNLMFNNDLNKELINYIKKF